MTFSDLDYGDIFLLEKFDLLKNILCVKSQHKDEEQEFFIELHSFHTWTTTLSIKVIKIENLNNCIKNQLTEYNIMFKYLNEGDVFSLETGDLKGVLCLKIFNIQFNTNFIILDNFKFLNILDHSKVKKIGKLKDCIKNKQLVKWKLKGYKI
jgi:hypothetical protein